jgi:creatinine amidohydrolase/Fe(II)-dependent formamide hydrolase-like protein
VTTLALEQMTWPEIRAAIDRGFHTVIVPLGSTEQHGPHLPLCVDSTVVVAAAHRVAEILGHALVAPVVPIGCSKHHLGFSGSLTLRPETLIDYVGDVAESLATGGFRAAFFFTGHGGNLRPLAEGLPRIRARAPSLHVVAYADYERFMPIFHESAARQGIAPLVAGRHSGESETSMMLAIEPALVREDRTECGYMGDPDEARRLVQAEGMHRATANGVLGDPRGATAARGRVYLEDFATAMAEYFRRERLKHDVRPA